MKSSKFKLIGIFSIVAIIVSVLAIGTLMAGPGGAPSAAVDAKPNLEGGAKIGTARWYSTNANYDVVVIEVDDPDKDVPNDFPNKWQILRAGDQQSYVSTETPVRFDGLTGQVDIRELQDGAPGTIANTTLSVVRGGNFALVAATNQDDAFVDILASSAQAVTADSTSVSLRPASVRALDPIPSINAFPLRTFEGTSLLPGATRLEITYTATDLTTGGQVVITGTVVNEKFEPVGVNTVDLTTTVLKDDSKKTRKLDDPLVEQTVTYDLGTIAAGGAVTLFTGTADAGSDLTSVRTGVQGGTVHFWAAVTKVAFKVRAGSGNGTLRIQETHTIAFKYQFDKADQIKAATIVNSSVAPEPLRLTLKEEVKSTNTTSNFGVASKTSGIFRAYVRLTNNSGLNNTTITDAANTKFGTSLAIQALKAGTEQTYLFVTDGSAIIVNYTDNEGAAGVAKAFSLQGTVDLSAPTITKVSPGSFSNAKRPAFTVTISDQDVPGQTSSAGIKKGDATLFLNDTQVMPEPTTTDLLPGADTREFTMSSTPSKDQVEAPANFWAVVKDAVGNAPDIARIKGSDSTKPFTTILDFSAPVINSAKTGGELDRNSVFADDSGKRKNVKVQFNLGTLSGETGLDERNRAPIDPDELQAADFAVGGVTPIKVEISKVAVGTKFKETGTVLLSMADDLPSDARPKVEVVGTIKDRAGNSMTLTPTPSKDATDGLGPKIAITVVPKTGVGSRPTDKMELTIVITSDELLVLDKPGIRLTYLKKDGGRVKRDVAQTTTKIPKAAAGNNAELKIDIDDITGGKVAGTVNVEAVWTDGGVKVGLRDVFENTASGEVGVEDPQPSSSVSKKAILFEFDNSMSTPAASKVDPRADQTKEQSDPFFVNIDWSSEGSEYVGDTHKKVFITSLKFDGATLATSDFSTTDNERFVLAVNGIAEGDHKLEVNAKDELGNTLSSAFKLEFKVSKRSPYQLDLRAGLNLVSVPADPLDHDINTVITDTAIDLVFTYDPNVPGRWPTAIRNADTGLFEGTLTTIDARHAYWMRAHGFPTVKIDIPPLGAALTVPPTINVTGGAWNLVPVMSVEALGTIKAGVEIDADTYLGKNWSRAITFNTLKVNWATVLPGDNLQCSFSGDTSRAAAECGTKVTTAGTESVVNGETVTIAAGGVTAGGLFSVTLASPPIVGAAVSVTTQLATIGIVRFDSILGKNVGLVQFKAGGAQSLLAGDTFTVTYATRSADTTITADTATPDSLDDGVQLGRGYWVLFTKDDTITPIKP